MKRRQLTFQFFDTQADALAFEKLQPRHLRGAVTPWTSQQAQQTGTHDYDNPEKWLAWYKH